MIKISPDLWESKYSGEVEARGSFKENKNISVSEKIENREGILTPVTFDTNLYKKINRISFIDGAQRLDMHATIEDNFLPFQGIFSSTAAGYLTVNPNKVNNLGECFPEEMPVLRRYFILPRKKLAPWIMNINMLMLKTASKCNNLLRN
jgi:hypothetical protein